MHDSDSVLKLEFFFLGEKKNSAFFISFAGDNKSVSVKEFLVEKKSRKKIPKKKNLKKKVFHLDTLTLNTQLLRFSFRHEVRSKNLALMSLMMSQSGAQFYIKIPNLNVPGLLGEKTKSRI